MGTYNEVRQNVKLQRMLYSYSAMMKNIDRNIEDMKDNIELSEIAQEFKETFLKSTIKGYNRKVSDFLKSFDDYWIVDLRKL